ncbi:general stress protein [Promicromonospora iranensis]|uniref:general stress protein n=1 Tax=Promicromonospora iranensis TaxID=1105144 RepID=UPI0023A9ABFE|nr:general stress protein [Promicromonospora iranensis]
MSMSRPGAVPKVPTLPAGDEVAAYSTYLEAQKAVDYLSDNKFPVENVTIVGTDLRMVERVTGRLTYGRVALAGALSGAWFGFFVGLLITLFAGEAGFQVMFAGIALGAGFGLLFSVLSYAFTGGRRDFTSSSQIVAATYAILCAHDHASDARALLMRSPSGLGKSRGNATVGVPAPAVPPSPTAQAPGAEPAQPAATPTRPTDPRWVTPTGEPRYGAMRPGAGAAGAPAPAETPAGAPAGAPASTPTDAPTGTPADAPTGAPTGAPADAPADAPSDAPTPPDQASGAPDEQRPDTTGSPDDSPTSRTRYSNPYAPPSDDQK